MFKILLIHSRHHVHFTCRSKTVSTFSSPIHTCGELMISWAGIMGGPHADWFQTETWPAYRISKRWTESLNLETSIVSWAPQCYGLEWDATCRLHPLLIATKQTCLGPMEHRPIIFSAVTNRAWLRWFKLPPIPACKQCQEVLIFILTSCHVVAVPQQQFARLRHQWGRKRESSYSLKVQYAWFQLFSLSYTLTNLSVFKVEKLTNFYFILFFVYKHEVTINVNKT